MTIFDGNQGALKIKHEMDNPKNFMTVVAVAQIVETLVLVVFSILTYLSFGPQMKSPIVHNLFGSPVVK